MLANKTFSSALVRWVKFGFCGIANTLFTYILFCFLSEMVHHQVAFFIAYCTGIIFAYWVNSRFVFAVKMSLKSFFSYPLVYIVGYVLSSLFLEVSITGFGLSLRVAPLLTVVLVTPVTYLLNKLVLLRT